MVDLIENIIALCVRDKKIYFCKNSLEAKKYAIWIHVLGDFESISSELGVSKNVLKDSIRAQKIYSLQIPIENIYHNLNILIVNGKVYSWSSKVLEKTIRNIMETCILAKQATLKSILESIVTYVTNILFTLLEKTNSELDVLEELAPEKPDTRKLHKIIKKIRKLRRTVSGLYMFTTNIALNYKISERVVGDVRHLINQIDSTFERIGFLTQFNYMVLSDKVNTVVQKLTIISAIFLPLTLIASIYGMNFRYMPELENPLGYPAVLIAMAIIAVGQLIYFKKKGWI